MRKISVTIVLACALILGIGSTQAKEKHRNLTSEQKAVYKELLEKYDTNKDGKLDKAEKAQITKLDKRKLREAGLSHRRKAGARTKKTDAVK